ncbi:unnamed protein product [Caenorhabditis brenneri]
MIAFISILLLVSIVTPSEPRMITDEMFMTAISNLCRPGSMSCPRKEFSTNPMMHEWDKAAILASPVISDIRNGKVEPEDWKALITHTFCCKEGDCLRECRIFRITESSLVEGFPGNTDQIFSLPIPALQRYKPHVDAFKKIYGLEGIITPAEIEEYFDYLAANERKLKILLALQ